MLKHILSKYLYVFSFTLLNAFFIAYGLNNAQFFIAEFLWGFIPAFAITALILLFAPYGFILEIILYIYATIWNTVTVFQAVVFENEVDVPSLYIMTHTAGGEILHFLKFFLSFKILLILFCIWFIPLYFLKISRKYDKENSANNDDAFYKIPSKWTFQKKFALIIFALILMLLPMHDRSFLFSGLRGEGIVISNIDENIRKPFYIKYTTMIPKMLKFGELNIEEVKGVSSSFKDTQNVILIITESSNRNHFSLYGYPRKTTPELDKMDLIVYEDVISPSPVTSRSIPHMLTFSNLVSDKNIATIYDIFKAAGFATYSFGGNVDGSLNDIIHIINHRAEHFELADRGDKGLFEDALKILKTEPAQKKLIVIFTVVTHFPYKPFYPEDMTEFTDTPPLLFPNANPQPRNEYDTAIRYIDMIVSDFLHGIKDMKNTIAIVTSDHGQEVANTSTFYGHSNSSKYPSCYEVPFYLQISDDYKKSLNKHVFDTKRPYQTDNLLHSIIDIAHIKTKLFNPEYSIFNEQYKKPVQKILNEEYLNVKKQDKYKTPF